MLIKRQTGWLTFLLLAIALVMGAGTAQAITVSVSNSIIDDQNSTLTFITNAPEPYGVVVLTIHPDYNSDGLVDTNEPVAFDTVITDNATIDTDGLGPTFVGDGDPTDQDISVTLIDNFDFFPAGDFVVRVTNELGEVATDTFSVTPTPPSITVTGTVYEDGTSTPVPGAIVAAMSNATGQITATSADGSGNFTLPIASSAIHFFRVWHTEYLPDEDTMMSVPGGGLTGQSLYLVPTDAQISGTVTEYGTANPIFGVDFYAQNINDTQSLNAYSDGNGNYSLDVKSGEDWVVSIDGHNLPGYFGFMSDDAYNYDPRPLVTPPGIANFTGHPVNAWVNATVLDEYGVLPLINATVRVEISNSPAPELDGLYNANTTDFSGVAFVGVNATGWDISVCVTDCNEEYPVLVNGTSVEMVPPLTNSITLTEFETRDITLNAFYADAAIEGIVYMPDGFTPASNATVHAWTANALNGVGQTSVGQLDVDVGVNSDGTFRLPLLGGSWNITAYLYDSNYQSDEYNYVMTSDGDEVITSGETTTGVILQLEPSTKVYASPISLDFGNVPVDGSSPAQIVTLYNWTNGQVQISNAVMSGPDAGNFDMQPALTEPCSYLPTTLEANSSCSMIVSLMPHSTGVINTTFTVDTDDVTSPVLSVDMQGTGVTSLGQISGTLDYSGSETGVPVVALFRDPLACAAPNPKEYLYVELGSVGAYSIGGLPDGTYYAGAAIRAGGMEISPSDPWGEYGGCGSASALVISGGNAISSVDITLADGTNPLYQEFNAHAGTEHDNLGYYAGINVYDPGANAISVQISGPAIVNGPISMVYNATEGYWNTWDTPEGWVLFGTVPPSAGALPLQYEITIDDGGAPITRTVSATGFVEDYADNLWPANGYEVVIGAPEFEWELTGGGEPEFEVILSGPGIWWEKEGLTETNAVYNGPALTPGNSYWWEVFVEDPTGSHNSSRVSTTFLYNGTFSDSDGDTYDDDVDNCPSTFNPAQVDTDGDGQGDACDAWPNDPNNDVDGDGVAGPEDNCPDAYNPGQVDVSPADGIGDVCYDYGQDITFFKTHLFYNNAQNDAKDGLKGVIVLNHGGDSMQPVGESDILDIKLRNDATSGLMNTTGRDFRSAAYLLYKYGWDGGAVSTWKMAYRSYFNFFVDSDGPLVDNYFNWEVDTAYGNFINSPVYYPNHIELPPVLSDSMSFNWPGDGSLELFWSNPSSDQLRVVMFDESNEVLFKAFLPGGQTSFTLPPALVNSIAGLRDFGKVEWRMSVMDYETVINLDINGNGKFNFARGISRPVRITGFDPDASTPSALLSAASLDFGETTPGDTAPAQLVSIDNIGTGDLVMESLALLGANSGLFNTGPALTDPCPGLPFALAPGDSCGVIVNFVPDSTGIKNATLVFNSNDPAVPATPIDLAGEGATLGTVSGTVDYGGLTPDGPVIVGLADAPIPCADAGTDNLFTYQFMMDVGAYAIANVPDGTYYAFALIANGPDTNVVETSPWGVYGGCGTATPLVIDGNDLSGTNISMINGTIQANPIWSYYDVESNPLHSVDGYEVDIYVRDAIQNATSVTVDGPGIASGPQSLIYNGNEGAWVTWDTPEGNPSFTSRPALPLVYTITIDGSIVKTMTVRTLVEDYVHSLNPSGGAAVYNTPVFSWEDQLGGSYDYTFGIHDDTGFSWHTDEENVPNPYTYGGPPLSLGTTYDWHVGVVDRFGNSSIVWDSFLYSADEPNITQNMGLIDFGDVTVGVLSFYVPFEVTNSGTQDLIIGTVSLSGTHAADFSMTDNCTGQTLTPSATCSVDVYVTASATGTRDATLNIPSNDPDTPVLSIPATANGVVTYSLSVTFAGTGVGNVTSSPGGIACGPGTIEDCTEDYGDGTSVALTATPDGSSIFSGWGGVGAGCVSGTNNPCNFNITSNTSSTATFDPDVTPTHTITPTAFANGSISPSSPVEVTEGDDQGFTITPDLGFVIDDVLVDGQSVGPTSAYTFVNVTTTHYIEALFTPEFSARPLIANVGDYNGNGYEDIGVLTLLSGGAGNYVQIRDSFTGNLIKNIWFTASFDIRGVISLPDIDGSGYPEVAVFGQTSGGRPFAQVKDVDTGASLKFMKFSPPDLELKGAAIVPDMNGNGVVELVVFGRTPIYNAPVAHIKDSLTGAHVKVLWFNPLLDELDMVIMPDLNANAKPEVALFGRFKTNGRGLAFVRDSLSGVYVKNVWFDWAITGPEGLSAVPDFNSDGVPEYAAYGTSAGGSSMANIKDGATGAHIKTIYFNSSLKVRALEGLPDVVSVDGSSEVVALGIMAGTGKRMLQYKEAADGAQLYNTFVDKNYIPRDMAVVPDINANGAPEIAVLEEHKYTGARMLYLKDSLTGELLISIPFPAW